MKKLIIGGVAVIIIAIAVAFNFNLDTKKDVSIVTLGNIEALANNETSLGNDQCLKGTADVYSDVLYWICGSCSTTKQYIKDTKKC